MCFEFERKQKKHWGGKIAEMIDTLIDAIEENDREHFKELIKIYCSETRRTYGNLLYILTERDYNNFPRYIKKALEKEKYNLVFTYNLAVKVQVYETPPFDI